MRLYCVHLETQNGWGELTPVQRREQARKAVRMLLNWALRRDYGRPAGALLAKDETGRPFLPDCPGLHVSISHSGAYVLCGLGEAPLGVDIQQRRPISEQVMLRLTDDLERQAFDFFDLWALRESCYKLTGTGSLRSSRFRRTEGDILAPLPGVQCRLYGDVPGYGAAACAFSGADFPATLEMPELREIWA